MPRRARRAEAGLRRLAGGALRANPDPNPNPTPSPSPSPNPDPEPNPHPDPNPNPDQVELYTQEVDDETHNIVQVHFSDLPIPPYLFPMSL